MVSLNEFRFNELHRTLNNFGAKMSKPTLIQHLQHLLERDFIVRKEVEKQKVTYEANWEKFEYIKKSLEHKQRIILDNENQKRFKSLEPKEQLETLCYILALGELLRIKIELDDFLEPDKKPEHRFSYIFMSKFLDMYRLWFQDTLNTSTKKGVQELMDTLEKGISMLRNEIFTSVKPESD
jgi:DNA-binding HxlR family transcriptional regulator